MDDNPDQVLMSIFGKHNRKIDLKICKVKNFLYFCILKTRVRSHYLQSSCNKF